MCQEGKSHASLWSDITSQSILSEVLLLVIIVKQNIIEEPLYIRIKPQDFSYPRILLLQSWVFLLIWLYITVDALDCAWPSILAKLITAWQRCECS